VRPGHAWKARGGVFDGPTGGGVQPKTPPVLVRYFDAHNPNFKRRSHPQFWELALSLEVAEDLDLCASFLQKTCKKSARPEPRLALRKVFWERRQGGLARSGAQGPLARFARAALSQKTFARCQVGSRGSMKSLHWRKLPYLRPVSGLKSFLFLFSFFLLRGQFLGDLGAF